MTSIGRRESPGREEGGTLSGVGHGTVLARRYRLEDQLHGDGGGLLWRAVDDTLERQVAVRIVAADHPHGAEVIDAARRAALVDDPRLVRVLDVGRSAGTAYIVTEYVQGRLLTEYLRQGQLPAETIRRIVGETAEALDRAGSRGLHHLQLSTESICVLPDGSIKLIGTAIEAAAAAVEIEDADEASRADAHALVRLLYGGLTGRWPGVTDGPLDPAPRVAGGAVPPAELAAGVPADLDALCASTLGPRGRGPRSPAEVAARLAPWARAAPLTEPQGLSMTAPERPVPPAPRRPTGEDVVARSKSRRKHQSKPHPRRFVPGPTPTGSPTDPAAVPVPLVGSDEEVLPTTDPDPVDARVEPVDDATPPTFPAPDSSTGEPDPDEPDPDEPDPDEPDPDEPDPDEPDPDGTTDGPGPDGPSEPDAGTEAHSEEFGADAESEIGAADGPDDEPTDEPDDGPRSAAPSATMAAGAAAEADDVPAPSGTGELSAANGHLGADERHPETVRTDLEALREAARAHDHGIVDPTAVTQVPGPPSRGASDPFPTDAPLAQPPLVQAPAFPVPGGEERRTWGPDMSGSWPTPPPAAGSAHAGSGAATRSAGPAGPSLDRRADVEVTHGPGPRGVRRLEPAPPPSLGGSHTGWSGVNRDDERLGPFMPPVPVARPPKRQARVALLIIGLLVVVGLVLSVIALRGLLPSSGPNTPVALPSPSGSASAAAASNPSVAAEPIDIVGVKTLDPQGDGTENDTTAARAIDGNTRTAWRSERYDNAAFGGLSKSGVGLLVDLGVESRVSEITVQQVGTGGAMELRTATEPTFDTSKVVASTELRGGTLVMKLDQPQTTRYLVLWFTKVTQQSSGEYRLLVSEVSVR